MTRRYTAQTIGTGLQARSLVGHALSRSASGRAITDELRTMYGRNAAAFIGTAIGRIIVLVRGAGLAAQAPEQQVAEARRIESMTRAHLADGPWYARRLARRALTAVFEDETAEAGCAVLRYVECTAPAIHDHPERALPRR